MIVKYGKYVNGVFRGETGIKKMYKGGFGVIWDNPYNSETTRILMTNFPTKFVEICRYGNWHTQIVPFINEDPMLVCSLGIEGMPIRWLVGDGTAYINTGIVMKDISHIFEVTCRWNGTNTGAFQTIFGFIVGGNVPRLGLHQYQGKMMFGTNSSINTSYTVDKVARDYIYNATTGDVSRRNIGSGNFSIIGNAGKDSSSFNANTLPIFLFARNNGGHNNGYVGDVARFKDNDSIELVPFKSTTREGMVDLVNATFHQNQGAGHFTDTYTLQDGVTIWKPYV